MIIRWYKPSFSGTFFGWMEMIEFGEVGGGVGWLDWIDGRNFRDFLRISFKTFPFYSYGFVYQHKYYYVWIHPSKLTTSYRRCDNVVWISSNKRCVLTGISSNKEQSHMFSLYNKFHIILWCAKFVVRKIWTRKLSRITRKLSRIEIRD